MLGSIFIDPASQKAVIQIFRGANSATLPHEIGHFIRLKMLAGDDLLAVESALGIKNGKWTVADEELFARMHEQYLRSGEAPNRALRGVFAKMKRWMGKVYGEFRLESNPEVRRVLDDLYGTHSQSIWDSMPKRIPLGGAGGTTREYMKRTTMPGGSNGIPTSSSENCVGKLLLDSCKVRLAHDKS